MQVRKRLSKGPTYTDQKKKRDIKMGIPTHSNHVRLSVTQQFGNSLGSASNEPPVESIPCVLGTAIM